ncbi:MAG: hypothetical protein WA196_16070, partial [Pseudolabrys sp.]
MQFAPYGVEFQLVMHRVGRVVTGFYRATQYTLCDPCLSWRAWLDSARLFALFMARLGSGEVAEWLKA